MKKRRATRRTFDCPHCGEPVRAGSRSCRACGSDATTGWRSSEAIETGSLELPEGELDEEEYRGFLEREGLAPRRRRGRGVIALVVVLGILALYAFWSLLS